MNELRAKIKGKGHIEYTRFITIDGKEITYEELESGILEALRIAKESGDFDGKSVSDVYFDDENRLNIELSDGSAYRSTSLKGKPGRDYVLTDGDKTEIADNIKNGIKAYIDESIVDFTNKIDGKLSEVNNLVTKSVNDAKTAAIDALEFSKRAKDSENKAKDYLYSVNRSADDVKYYASNAISEMNLTKVSAHRDIDNQKIDAINAINRKQEETLSAVESAKEEAIDEIENSIPDIDSINGANKSLDNLDANGEKRFTDLKQSLGELGNRVKTLEDEPKVPDLSEEVNNLTNRVKSLEDEPKAPERTAQQIIEEHITATPDYGVYTVRFPKWETSHTATGEKLDDNQGLILTPATDTVKEVNTYPHAFDTVDVNAYVDDDGVRHITAIKGDKNFRDTGRVNVFVCFRTYWEKVWEEDGYEYYSRCFYPKEGYTINRLAINRDGTYNNWFLIAKYMAGNAIGEDGKPTHDLYSAKGLKCSHYMSSPTGSDELISDGISWQGMQSIFKKHGVFYTGSLMAELKHFHTTSMLYFATKHSQSVMYGLANSSVQYICAEPTENTNYFVVTDSQANNIDLMQCVSIGDNGLTTAPDRNIGLCHNIAYDCRVTKKEVLASGNVAIYIDHEAFTTTETSWISTFHEISGYSDYILGRTGSPVSNANGRHGMVMDGVELMMGAYETVANAIFNATPNPLERQVMYTNDATKLSSTVGTFMQRADVSDQLATVEKNGAWNYISEVYTDLDNGLIINTKSGLDGSNSSTGYADGQYFDTITTGQREVLSFGYLGNGAYAGLRRCSGSNGVSAADWHIAARLSVNAVGGELRSEA